MTGHVNKDFGRQQAIEATAWFSVLMHNRQASNFQEAAKAQSELQRLGVVVRFCQLERAARTEEVNHAR